ncbi:MAG: hypothetical protein NT140_04660 [Deltaproteobacteria bacterium]|nr:hypothetical protein [Deltaproteobacteria bacterium]
MAGNYEMLLDEHKIHPHLYCVDLRGKRERTVSIRIGVSWPQPDKPGYYVLVAQLEPTAEDRNMKRARFLAFEEGESAILHTFFEKIEKVCGRKRVNEICHGDDEGELSFSRMLSEHLKDNGKNFPNIPTVWKSYRCKDTNFLIQLVRNFIANHNLLFFNNSDNRTPLLLGKVRNAGPETDILKIPELKALAYVMDDFDCNPWKAPEPKKKEEKRVPWAF